MADEWTALERLALAQAIYRYGESWPTISRTLRQHPALLQQRDHFRLTRTPTFYSQKNCATEYSRMLAALEGQRKVKRTLDPTAQEIPPLMRLLRNLFTQRVGELNDAIKADEDEFQKLLDEYAAIKRGDMDARLPELLRELGVSLSTLAGPPAAESAAATPEPTAGGSSASTPVPPADAPGGTPRDAIAVAPAEVTDAAESAATSDAATSELPQPSPAADASPAGDSAESHLPPAKRVKTERSDAEGALTDSRPSESPAAAAPQSPPASAAASTPAAALATDERREDREEDEEDVKRHKAWKKNILALWRELAAHRYAPVFLTAVREDSEPLYYRAVKEPLDLTMIKQRVQDGTTRTIDEFHRDLLHLFQNALMYNNDYHQIYEMAIEMLIEVERLINDYRSAQAAALGDESVPSDDALAVHVKRGRKAGPESPTPSAGEPSTPASGSRKRRR